MTPTGTPDDEPKGGRSEPERPQTPEQAPPPPPQWLDQDRPPGAHLLPETEPLPEFGSPPPEPADEGLSDRTVTDLDISGTMRTQIFPQGDRQGPPQGPPSFSEASSPSEQAPPFRSGPSMDETITDLSEFMPAGAEAAGAADDDLDDDEDEDLDRTRVERPSGTAPPKRTRTQVSQPFAAPEPATQQIPAPMPEPATEQIEAPQPPAPQPPAPPVPQPRPQPPAPEPFPWAQEMPGPPQPPAPQPPAPSAPSAPEPFPWAQEIPAAPQPPAPQPPAPQPPAPSAPEPFPWAQEIPETPHQHHQQQAPQPAPFPWAQEIPGQQAGAHQQAAPDLRHQAVPPPQINEPWRTDAPSKRAKRRLNKKVLFGAVGGVAAVALVAAGAVVLLGGDDGSDGGDDGARLAGKLFPADPAARSDGRDQELTGVAAVGSTVVAAGGEADPGNYRGVLLYSTDGGRTFKSADVQGADGGEPANGEVPRQVAGGPRGWVAIGTRPGGGAVWTSTDGRTWRRLPDAAGDAFGPGNRVQRVIGTDGGFLAVGENSRKGDFSDSVPAAWLSPDGQRWEALTGGQVGIPVRGRVSLIEAAASGGAVLVESQHTPAPGKPTFRRVWKSSDGGRTWAPAKVPAPKGTRNLIIGGGRPGLMAIREVKSGSSAYGQVFTSTDGERWKQGGRIRSSGYRQVDRVLASDGGYVGVVSRGRDTLVVRSADGASWQEAGTLASNSGRALQGVAASGEQTVLVGRDTGTGDLNSLLAVRDARGTEVPVDPAKIPGAVRPDHAVTGLAAKDGRAVAVGSSGGEATVWTSPDGAAWNRAQFPGGMARPLSQRLTGVAAGANGWLAVGDGGGQPRRSLVVTSADGASWQAADGNQAFAQNGQQSLATFGAAAGPSGYVIVGEDGLSGATWFSADLKNWQRGRGVGRNDLTALPKGNRWLRSAVGGAFGYVAAGGVQDPAAQDAPGQRPAVWNSTDGKQWRLHQLPLPAGLSEGSLTNVTAKGDLLVALGSASGSAGSVPLGYVSSDGGKTWRGVTLPAPVRELRVTALTATPKGFAAAGASTEKGTSDVVSWTSADGSAWQAATPGAEGLAGQGDQQITGLVALGGKLLGVGRSAGAAGEEPVLWTRPVP
ncbi:sialidase family protein [Actinomadura xylanilytica]|uniref:sialidase family protein n=1 Tax=Actinomadura xylanilytica TaxID=887459 RepID=UPI00255ADB64|nr:sialidase family protein [Actinomadura xylanilytica]MDL4772840.1 sialidase family protein [Actinomadura xylanilytica]